MLFLFPLILSSLLPSLLSQTCTLPDWLHHSFPCPCILFFVVFFFSPLNYMYVILTGMHSTLKTSLFFKDLFECCLSPGVFLLILTRNDEPLLPSSWNIYCLQHSLNPQRSHTTLSVCILPSSFHISNYRWQESCMPFYYLSKCLAECLTLSKWSV